VFWVVTPSSDVVGHQCFGDPCYLHHQDEVVFYNIITWCHNSEDHDMNLHHHETLHLISTLRCSKLE